MDLGSFTKIAHSLSQLVAAIMVILYIVQTYTGMSFWWATPDTIATIIGLLTPVLVWSVPNKKVGIR